MAGWHDGSCSEGAVERNRSDRSIDMSSRAIIGNIAEANLAEDTPAAIPTKSVWTGRIITGLVVPFLLVDAVGHLVKAEAYIEATVELGYSADIVVWLGITLLVCTLLYAIPRTSILGGILLTGYLGGATATQVRLEEPAFLFSVVLGVLAWAGLYLRDHRLRAILAK
jgi:hypothetical protein